MTPREANAEQGCVCYSAIIGDYDGPPNIVDADPRIQFFLFSDTLQTAPVPWTVVKVENYFQDGKITSGFFKSNPEMLFDRNSKVVWIDANLRDVKLNVEHIDQWLVSKPIAAPRHQLRNRVGDEFTAVVRAGVEDEISASRLMDEMRDLGFDDDQGLSATMLLARDLADHRVHRVDEVWWDAIRSGARRDQISFEFAVWSAGLVCEEIAVDHREPNAIFRRVAHANPQSRKLPARSFVAEEIESRWRAFRLPPLPANYPQPQYFRERWTSSALRAVREINAAVVASGEALEGNYCYFHNRPISERTPPDPRRSWKREILRLASLAGYRALEVGFNAGHSALIMLDANPLLHLTAIDIGEHGYTAPCAAILAKHFAGRFSFQPGSSTTQLAGFDQEFARQFDIIHIDGGHREETVTSDWQWVMRNASPGCCIIVDDAYVAHIDRLIADGTKAGYVRPARLPLPCSGENRVLFKIRSDDA